MLFLVVEAKGYDSNVDIPTDERRKIEYGKRFFESLQRGFLMACRYASREG